MENCQHCYQKTTTINEADKQPINDAQNLYGVVEPTADET